MQEQNKLEMDKLVLEGRKKLSMTGVDAVESFSDQNLKLKVAGNKVSIFGENIKITSYNKSSGILSAEGVFNEIKYAHAKAPLIKRIFK